LQTSFMLTVKEKQLQRIQGHVEELHVPCFELRRNTEEKKQSLLDDSWMFSISELKALHSEVMSVFDVEVSFLYAAAGWTLFFQLFTLRVGKISVLALLDYMVSVEKSGLEQFPLAFF
ncbi:hypothetical protein STEG23_035638, partial [Scotinomys teguina]